MPMTIHKGKMTPRDETAQVPFFQNLAGGLVRDGKTGERLLTHEYGHKSFQNLVYSLSQRQLGCLTGIDDDCIEEFREMVNAWMDDWVPKFKEEWTPTCCFEYVENQTSFSRSKKLKYILGLIRMLTDPRYRDYVGHF